MRYRLRTLLILLAILPPLLWIGWTNYEAWRAEQELLKALREAAPQVQRPAITRWQLIRSPMVLAPVGSDAEVTRTPELLRDPDPTDYTRQKLREAKQGTSDAPGPYPPTPRRLDPFET
jgi:hypothetical protein